MKSSLISNEYLEKTLIAVPVYNEEECLDTVIGRIKEFATNILIINDGSTDKTAEMLKSHKDISVIQHKNNSGYGRSLIDALQYAKNNNLEWLITMDCDLQHEPETLPLFYKTIEKGKYDIISGSRYLDPANRHGVCPPKSRVSINKEITYQLKKTLGLEITDSFCGFKAYRIGFMNKMKLTIDGYAFPLQVWVQSARLAVRLTEIPVKMIYSDTFRSFGKLLDNPEARLNYYIETLNQELDKYGYKKIEYIKNTFRKRCDTHIA